MRRRAGPRPRCPWCKPWRSIQATTRKRRPLHRPLAVPYAQHELLLRRPSGAGLLAATFASRPRREPWTAGTVTTGWRRRCENPRGGAQAAVTGTRGGRCGRRSCICAAGCEHLGADDWPGEPLANGVVRDMSTCMNTPEPSATRARRFAEITLGPRRGYCGERACKSRARVACARVRRFGTLPSTIDL